MPDKNDFRIVSLEGDSFQEVLDGTSPIAQGPTALDTIHQITFGAAQGDSSTPVQLTAAGDIIFQPPVGTTGVYTANFTFTVGRSSSTNEAHLFVRLVANANPIGSYTTGPLTVDNADDTRTFTAFRQFRAVNGDTLRAEIWRDSGGAGENDGGFEAFSSGFLGGNAVNTAVNIQLNFLI